VWHQTTKTEIANASEYGLQASVFTQNFSRAVAIAEKRGGFCPSRRERGPDHFPFLGVKEKGMHGISRTIESMTREKLLITKR
jgi:glyceraldehyde-3-phosphate dehydrogenase (NADP+)